MKVPLIVFLGGSDGSSVVSGCDLPKLEPWGEEILHYVDHMWVVSGSYYLLFNSTITMFYRRSAAQSRRPC